MSATPPMCTECGADFHTRADDSSHTIDALISRLAAITCALEKHTTAMIYPGTDEFNVHTFGRHPFDDSASEALHDLAQRIEGLSNDLCSAEDEHRSFEALTPAEQLIRTTDFEELARAAKASIRRHDTWERGAAAREIAWAALPSEATAPGRCHESAKICPECGGAIGTIDGIHRCWACFRRGQNGS